MDGTDGDGQQLLAGIAEHAACLGIDIENPVRLRINDENRVVRMLEDLAVPFLEVSPGALRPHPLGLGLFQRRDASAEDRRFPNGVPVQLCFMAHPTNLGNPAGARAYS